MLLGDLQATGGRLNFGADHTDQPELRRGKCVECKGEGAVGPNGERVMDFQYLPATDVYLCDMCQAFDGPRATCSTCGFFECECFTKQYMDGVKKRKITASQRDRIKEFYEQFDKRFEEGSCRRTAREAGLVGWEEYRRTRRRSDLKKLMEIVEKMEVLVPADRKRTATEILLLQKRIVQGVGIPEAVFNADAVPGKWVTKDGRCVSPKEMGLDHLVNTIRMLDRKMETDHPMYNRLVEEYQRRQRP